MTQSIPFYYLPRKPWRLFSGVMIPFFLSFLIPTYLIAELRTATFSAGLVIAWVIMLYSSVRLGMFAVGGQKKIVSMTFWIYVYIFLGLSSVLQLAARQFPAQGYFTEKSVLFTFLIILVGLFSYEMGRLLAMSKLPDLFPPITKPNTSRIIDPNRTIFFSIVALIVITLLIVWMGGLRIILIPRHERFLELMALTQGDSQAKFQMVSSLLRIPQFVGAIFLGALWQRSRKSLPCSRINIFSKFLFLILIVVTLLVNNPVSTPRYWIGTIIFSFVFIFLRWRRQRSFSVWVIIIILSFIFVFPVADAFRNTSFPDFNALISSISAGDQFIKKGDFDSFMQINNTFEYVEKRGVTYGRQLIGTMLFWVPRSVWVNKPISSGKLVVENMGYEYTNLSCPLWAEAYLDGGLPGIFVVFVIYGFLTFKLEKQYLKHHQFDVTLLNAFVPFFSGYQIFVLRGALMPAFAYFLPVLLVMVLMTKRENNGVAH